MPSDVLPRLPVGEENDLSRQQRVAALRPEAAPAGGLHVSGGELDDDEARGGASTGVRASGAPTPVSVFGGTGRPSKDESDRRRCEFLRLIKEGIAGDEAARSAQIDPYRALAILTHPDVRPLLAA